MYNIVGVYKTKQYNILSSGDGGKRLSPKFVDLYQTIRRRIPEDNLLRSHCRENLNRTHPRPDYMPAILTLLVRLLARNLFPCSSILKRCDTDIIYVNYKRIIANDKTRKNF